MTRWIAVLLAAVIEASWCSPALAADKPTPKPSATASSQGGHSADGFFVNTVKKDQRGSPGSTSEGIRSQSGPKIVAGTAACAAADAGATASGVAVSYCNDQPSGPTLADVQKAFGEL
ncbi:hypothetical protein, partial [Nocardioides albidus]|uniref:hypothetical protein n=1 Tax=Nocardioides albidus TaxID=1517589 RepID=UPI00195F629B